jgi:chromatin assembly factor 1 subunit B
MKVETPQILWNSEGDKNVNAALLSVAVLGCGSGSGRSGSNNGSQRGDAGNATMILATAGNSSVVNLWAASAAAASSPSTDAAAAGGGTAAKVDAPATANLSLAFRCSLGRQDGACNCVRFSPNGMHLAAASEQAVVVWTVPPQFHVASHSSNSINSSTSASSAAQHFWANVVSREQDLQFKVAARNGEAFMDLAWSADSTRIVAGSIDHSVVVCEYSMEQEAWRTVYRHDDHAHFVQGVAFDPLNVYVASMSSDRTVRLHGRKKPPAAKNKGGRKSLLASNNNNNVLAATTAAKVNASSAGADSTSSVVSAVATTPIAAAAAAGNGSAPTAGAGITAAAAADSRKLEMTKSKLIKYYRTPPSSSAAAAAAAASTTNNSSSNPESQPNQQQQKHLFQDEATLESFVRRLAFTTDGAYLVAPAAQWWRPAADGDPANSSAASSTAYANATLMFARHKWDEPCRVLVGMQKVTRAH